MEEVVYLNGALLPRGQARISPFDLGFLYGYGLFETMRAYSGRIFRLSAHLARLEGSAKLLGLPVNSSEIERACYDTLNANLLENARIRLSVSMGEAGNSGEPPPEPSPTRFITAQAYTPPSDEKYRAGYKAVVSPFSRNSKSPLSGVKSFNYLDNVLARKEARARGADEALLLNEGGFISEGSATNFFLVLAGKLVTPGKESGILAGITRDLVFELAQGLDIEVVQREIIPDELLAADEAFLTNSLIEVMPLTEVNSRPVGGGKMGMTSARLLAAYRQAVSVQTQA